MIDFFAAIEAGDVAAVRKYLEQDRSAANSIDSRTAPVDPLWKENARMVGDGSIDKPPKPHRPRTDTALHVAVLHRKIEIVRLLLDHGAQVNAVNQSQYTPLHYAMGIFQREALDLELIRLLVERGADVNARSKFGDIPIVMAFGWRRDPLPAIEFLLQHGADVNATGQQGRTALNEAMIFLGSPGDHVARVELLLRYGANVNPGRAGEYPWPPMCMVARNGNAAVARLLIEAGADVNATDRWGSPLTEAARKGHDKIVALLLKAGADPRALGREVAGESETCDQTSLELIRPFEETLDHVEKVLAEL